MATDGLTAGGIDVSVVRKPIKNLHIGVYPPDGHVRVAAPDQTPDSVIRAAVTSRLGWIRRQRRGFWEQARESRREMVSGESHWVLGRRYRMAVVEGSGRPGVRLLRASVIELRCAPGTVVEKRAELLDRWYRRQLAGMIAPLLEQWQPRLGVVAADWRIRKMRTKWASCSLTGRLWFNLELAKKPPRTLEYIVVHELAHLIDRRHGAEFQAILDRHYPGWRQARHELGVLPLGADTWAS